MLISTFIKRRILHLRHRWIGYLTSLLLIPLALYFTLQVSLGEWLNADWLFLVFYLSWHFWLECSLSGEIFSAVSIPDFSTVLLLHLIVD